MGVAFSRLNPFFGGVPFAEKAVPFAEKAVPFAEKAVPFADLTFLNLLKVSE